MEVTAHLTEKAQRDYTLVMQAVNLGDQKAYAELMNNYRESLYYMLLKMTNNQVDADDLTIEAFGKAFKNLHQYSPEYRPVMREERMLLKRVGLLSVFPEGRSHPDGQYKKQQRHRG